MRFLGLTRFSVVAERSLGSFRATRDYGYDKALARIMSPERLALRFALFETFTLPSIRVLMPREPDYWHFIAVSDCLPEGYAKRLRNLVTDLPRVRLLPMARRDDIRDTFRAALTETCNGSPAFTFRLDDDDALADNYFTLIRTAIDGCSRDVAVAVDDGFLLETAGERLYRLRTKNAPRIALGLGLLSTQSRTIFDLGNHTQIEKHMEVIHVRDRRGWVNVKHDYSDVRKKWWKRLAGWGLPKLSAPHVMERLGPHFAHIRLTPRHLAGGVVSDAP